MTKWLDFIVGASIILGVGGGGYYFWDDIMGEKAPGAGNYNSELHGGKKTRHRKVKKGKSIRRK